MADLRLVPFREGTAAMHLKGQIDAARFVEGERLTVNVPVADLFVGPDRKGGLASQLLYGETLIVYGKSGDYCWGQSETDAYVGYVPTSALGQARDWSGRIFTKSSQLYPEPTLKVAPSAVLPFLSRLDADVKGDYARTPEGYLPASHLEKPAWDFVAFAEAMLGVPYVWGGRSSFGLDCSALVQLACEAVGLAAPRDSDMQGRSLGEPVILGDQLRRGDLVFWKGHVGIMRDAETLIHATANKMRVKSEPLSEASERISRNEFGEITQIRRV